MRVSNKRLSLFTTVGRGILWVFSMPLFWQFCQPCVHTFCKIKPILCAFSTTNGWSPLSGTSSNWWEKISGKDT